MIRSAAQLRAVADGAPFPHAPPNFLLVHFFNNPPPADALETMVAPDGAETTLSGLEVYFYYPFGTLPAYPDNRNPARPDGRGLYAGRSKAVRHP